MTLFVGLDVSLKSTSICVVEANGSPIWEGKAESEPAPLIKVLMRRRTRSRSLASKLARCQNGFTARWSSAAFRLSALRRGTRNVSCRLVQTRPTAATREASPI